jgi:hypothetical protein
MFYPLAKEPVLGFNHLLRGRSWDSGRAPQATLSRTASSSSRTVVPRRSAYARSVTTVLECPSHSASGWRRTRRRLGAPPRRPGGGGNGCGSSREVSALTRGCCTARPQRLSQLLSPRQAPVLSMGSRSWTTRERPSGGRRESDGRRSRELGGTTTFSPPPAAPIVIGLRRPSVKTAAQLVTED